MRMSGKDKKEKMNEKQKKENSQVSESLLESEQVVKIVKQKLSGKKKLCFLAVATVVLAALAVCLGIYNRPENRLARQLNLGERYLEDQNYEQAVIAFNKVIAIDLMSVDAYLGLADAYIGMGDYEKAEEILKNGYDLTKNEELKRRWEGLSVEKEVTNNADTKPDSIDALESEKTNGLQQKLDELKTLFMDGSPANMFQFEELKFFGHDADNISLEELGLILTENEYKWSYNDDHNYLHSWFPGGYRDAPDITGYDSDYDGVVDILSFDVGESTGPEGQPMPIGIRDIYTYDTLEKVLTKLGFSNGNEIWEYIDESFADQSFDWESHIDYTSSYMISDNLSFNIILHASVIDGDDTVWYFEIRLHYTDLGRTVSLEFRQNEGEITNLTGVSIFY